MGINQQKPEAEARNNLSLDIHSIFDTIQGEGPFTGHRALFVRLAGCNLQCPHCDTEYTEGRKSYEYDVAVDHILGHLKQNCKLIVITGGEPFRQNIQSLIRLLISRSAVTVQVETNGLLGIPVGLRHAIHTGRLHVVVSPKTARIHESCSMASAFKYVVEAGEDNILSDGLPREALGHKAVPHVARPPNGYSGPIYINPMDAQDPVANKANMDAARDAAFEHGYVLGIQMHKIVGVP